MLTCEAIVTEPESGDQHPCGAKASHRVFGTQTMLCAEHAEGWEEPVVSLEVTS